MAKRPRPPVRNWVDLTVVGGTVGSRLCFVSEYVTQHLQSGVLPHDVEVVSVNSSFSTNEEDAHSFALKVRCDTLGVGEKNARGYVYTMWVPAHLLHPDNQYDLEHHLEVEVEIFASRVTAREEAHTGATRQPHTLYEHLDSIG